MMERGDNVRSFVKRHLKQTVALAALLLAGMLLTGCSRSGSILVQATPNNTSVYINNKFIGMTPLLIPELPVGNTNITLRHQDYYPKTVKVLVRADETIVVTERLTPLLSRVVDNCLTLSKPEHPVQLFFLNSFARLPSSISSSYYWTSLAKEGDAELTISTIELMAMFEFFDLSLEIALSPNAEEMVVMTIDGTVHLWDKTKITNDIYIVNPIFSKEQPVSPGGFVVVREDSKWKLLRITSSAATDAETVIRENEEWIQSITRSVFSTRSSLEKLETSAAQSATPEVSDDQSEDDTPRWRTIKEWAGKGNKQTETFEVTNHEWQLEWAATNERVIGFFGVMLYKANGQYVSMPINQTGEGGGSTYVRGAGKYYLDITAANLDWEIRVLDYK